VDVYWPTVKMRTEGFLLCPESSASDILKAAQLLQPAPGFGD
jgi:hypothetical protein